jgi:hypothetical protein
MTAELRIHLDVEAKLVNIEDGTEEALSEAMLREYHGLAIDRTFHDLPCLSDFRDHLKRARAELLFDKEKKQLCCRVSLTLSEPLDVDRERALVKVVRTKLWESNWGVNQEWLNPKVELENDELTVRVRVYEGLLGAWRRTPEAPQWTELTASA